MKTIEGLTQELASATDLTIFATIEEQKVAAHLLARTVREKYPTAKTIRLGESDQGDWLWVGGIDLTDGKTLVDGVDDDFDANYGAASHLYISSLDQIPGLTFRRDGWGLSDIVLDIQTVLDELETIGPRARTARGLAPRTAESIDNETCIHCGAAVHRTQTATGTRWAHNTTLLFCTDAADQERVP